MAGFAASSARTGRSRWVKQVSEIAALSRRSWPISHHLDTIFQLKLLGLPLMCTLGSEFPLSDGHNKRLAVESERRLESRKLHDRDLD